MSSEIKERTVYQLVRTDKPDDGTDIYVDSTSQPLKKRLQRHRTYVRISDSKLHTRMREVGIDKWKIIPLLTYPCDKKTICEFEKEWMKVLNADLNTVSPLGTSSKCKWYNEKGKGLMRKYYLDSIESKRYYCDICDKPFGFSYDLRKHLNSLKHSYAYLNSVD